MLHRHITTTSFIVSSDESLNKPSSLSSTSACGHSIDSGENMSTVTTNSIGGESQTDQSYFSQSSTDSITTNHAVGSSRMPSVQANGRFAMPIAPLPPPPPPPHIPLDIREEHQDPYTIDIQQQRPVSYIDDKLKSLIFNSTVRSSSQQAAQNHLNNANHRLSMSIKQDTQTNDHYTNQIKSFQHTLKRPTNNITQKSSAAILDKSVSTPSMPMNVKAMLINGLSSEEVMCNWLQSLKCDDLIKNFIEHGYDIHLMTRMTPQDLAAIGCKSPALRKKLQSEIKKLNLDYDLPEYRPMILEQWLDTLKLKSYYTLLFSEGYDTVEKTCQLTWEDLEEIGITKLGHQKRLLIGIEKVQKSLEIQEKRLSDSAIYDVHPQHRVSLGGIYSEGKMNTISRVRSGLFQTRSGANLDHRGLPVASVLPALKHISSPIIYNNFSNDKTVSSANDHEGRATNQAVALKMNDITSNIKSNPRPLPPVRTDSLKLTEANIGQSIYNNNYLPVTHTNGNLDRITAPKSASFACNMQFPVNYVTNQQATTSSQNTITPIRKAPLPPHMQNRLSMPGKIDEEPSETAVAYQQSVNDGSFLQHNMCNSNNNDDRFAMIGPNIASADEFPPPPP